MTARWISESDVADVLDLGTAIDALRAGFLAESTGDASNMLKTQVTWGDGHSLHAIGAVMPHLGLVGSKTWAHTSKGATPLEIVWSADTGELLAIIEAFVLGQFRTGGVSGLATDLLAAGNADVLAMVGTGKQARAQVAAVASVRTLSEVRVFSRDAERRSAFADSVEAEFGVVTRAAKTVAEAVDGAGVVTLATRATEPFLDASMMPAGGHLNAIGAIVPTRIEFEPALLDRAEIVVADSPAQARMQSAEFRKYFGDDEPGWASVRSLADVVRWGSWRGPSTGISAFKAMGSGIADLSLAHVILERVATGGLGAPFPRAHARSVPLSMERK
jgi:ornithine cyclodeaminase